MELFSENRIDDLEAKIDMLIKRYMEMKEENEKLLTGIQTLESQNVELKQQIESVHGEREIIIGKVKSILEKIEKVEA